MPKKSDLTLTDFISEYMKEGTFFDAGCNESELDAMAEKCHEQNINKPVCAVLNWQWWDLDVCNEDKCLLEKSGRYAALINATFVLFDEAGRFSSGSWVRTSLLTNFIDNCIFETRNTYYVLVGKGTRKTVNPAMPFSLSK